MVLVFDLDDTLYDEMTYVRSGLKAVSEFLYSSWNINKDFAYDLMLRELKENGRGKVFDVLLLNQNLYSKKNVKACISIYRKHKPKIILNKDATYCLKKFKDVPIYIVTDGNKIVQFNKINSLGLKEYVKRVIPTHVYGIDKAKPSPFCFIKIAEWEKVNFNEIIYIGDNPEKDFVGIKPLGFKTIRLITKKFLSKDINPQNEAHVQIESLKELSIDILQNLILNK